MCINKFFRKHKSEPSVPITVHTEVSHSIVVEEPPKPKDYLIGTSCYQDIIFPLDDIKRFIDGVADAGGTITEFFLCFTWQGGWAYQPFKLLTETWTEPGYPGHQFPIFDLDAWNEDVWEKWLGVFRHCKQRGVIPFVRIHDYCSVKTPIDKRYYCFRSNKQRFEGHLPGGLWGEPIKEYYSKLNAELIKTLGDAGCDKYYIVPMNEADYISDPGDTEELKDGKVLSFHAWHYNSLMGYGCARDQIVISTSRALQAHASREYEMELHGCNSPQMLYQFITMALQSGWKHGQFFANGDGLDKYAEGRMGDSPSKREPSVAQGHTMGQIIKENRLWGYAYFNRPTDVVGIRGAKFDVLEAMVRGYDGN